jgi:hypothetical protein
MIYKLLEIFGNNEKYQKITSLSVMDINLLLMSKISQISGKMVFIILSSS